MNIFFQAQQSSIIETPHAIFNKRGGVSKNRFDSLNTSFQVGDDHHAVTQNRELIKKALNIETMVSALQVHSDGIISVTATNNQELEFRDCDALISNQPGTGLLIQQADCQAILIHDPVGKTIAAIHCGWRGSVVNIISKTIAKMKTDYGSDPAELRGVISPSLGPCCAEFVNYQRELPREFHGYQVKANYFDFWEISKDQLKESGVIEHHIETLAQCTVCNPNYFSYRRSCRQKFKTTGRNCSIIALES